ncbi:hypothetical protein BC835DRAFT_736730 [Cytidiella melzeri]|nr:hypothetical protein BC835DRAFT_736730 [Cytidiella melzeri]
MVDAKLRLGSSFVWFGLVAAIIIGVILTVFRARNGQQAAAELRISRLQEIREIPTLWDVYIEPVHKHRDVPRHTWGNIVPLSLTVLRQPKPKIRTQQPPPSNSRLFSRFLRRSGLTNSQQQKAIKQMSVEDALLSMIIVFPDQYSHSSSTLLHEFAIATATTFYVDESLDESAS